MQGSVRWTRRYEGLIRASLRAAQDDVQAWSPLRDLGRLQATRAAPILMAKLGRPAGPTDEDRVRFAFQVLFGTLNNMVLVNPGPFTIHDEVTPRLLTETLTRLIANGYLTCPPPPLPRPPHAAPGSEVSPDVPASRGPWRSLRPKISGYQT